MRRSDYFIDEKGIFEVRSQSYPDSVWHHYFVEFDSPVLAEQFETFVQRVLKQGREERSRELMALLGR